MSSNDNSPIPAPPSPTQRRASFAPGQKLSEMFGRAPSTSAGSAAYPNSIAAAAANAQAQQGRRVSISTLGLSGSPTQTSPFTNGRSRKESMSSSTDESAIDDTDVTPGSAGPSPFTRRLSFGARAMRDVRGGGQGIFNGRSSSTSQPATAAAAANGATSAPRSSGGEVDTVPPLVSPSQAANSLTRRAGEGFNWSDQMRSRAERSTSISSSPTAASGSVNPFRMPAKSASVSGSEPPKEMPKASRAPDHFQERILKGDFYMD